MNLQANEVAKSVLTHRGHSATLPVHIKQPFLPANPGIPTGKEFFSMTNYELTFIISSDMPEIEAQNITAKIAGLITKAEGRIYSQNFWGKQRLAYPIGKHEYGYYATMVFNYPSEQIATFNHDIQLMPETIRHLILSLDKEKIRPEDIKMIDPFKEQPTPIRTTTRPTTMATRRTPVAKPVVPQKDEATRLKELDEKLGNLLKEE